MLKTITSNLFGCIFFILLVFNILQTAVQLFIFTFLKIIIPVQWWRRFIGKILIRISNNWVFINSWFIEHFFPIEWKITGVEKLNVKDWYLVISNHQSWVDIVILQKVLYGKIPFIKFFLKKELIWVPIMGAAWWALDFPFMKRFTKEQIEKNPKLKGKDLEITHKACEKFKTNYVTVMTFPEGTRFTQKKHNKQKSPYKYLLKPKAGGLSFTISAMGDRFHKMLDVTIVYPDGVGTMWDFICGKVKKIDVFINTVEIPEKFANMDIEDEKFQDEFKSWLNNIWLKKDKMINDNLSKKK